DEQLVRLGVASAKRPPAEFDRLEAALDRAVQLFTQRPRFIEENGAVWLDLAPIASSKQPRDRLVADSAHQVPQSDVDAADGVLDCAAPALPEGALAELFRDVGRLVGALAQEKRLQQLDRAGDERLAREDAADASQSFVRRHFDNGVDIVLRLQLVGPAPFD